MAGEEGLCDTRVGKVKFWDIQQMQEELVDPVARSGLPFPTPEELLTQGSNLCLLHWQEDFFLTIEPPRKPRLIFTDKEN